MSIERVLGADDKGLPADAAGLTVTEFLAREPRLAELWTPLLVLDQGALDDNIAFLAGWVAARGLELMPHGKTTMAPQLWRRQLDAGATGITVATPWQLRVAVDAGIPAVMLANQLAQPDAIRWASEAAAGTRIWSWVDDPAAIDGIERALGAAPSRPLEVLVDLGRPGGRTGVRSVAAAVALAERIAASPAVRLAGVAGYEGAVAHGRGAEGLDAARAFVDEILAAHDAFSPLYDDGDVLVTAGGSAYPDVVGTAFAAAAQGDRARFVLRSGAYIVHDHGYYRQSSPFEGAGLRPAARGIARVVSRPEPGLALIDGGKRDFPYDEGLPVPREVAAGLGEAWSPLTDASVTALNDQHAFLRWAEPDASPTVAPIGSVVALGLSHPCTAFDKWRVLPVVDSWESGRVVELVRTYF
jgi:D-serine deaminase-like pyridoxal phosphate-dependent protein